MIAHGLRCEGREQPLGLDQQVPRLSWQLRSGRRDDTQTSYEVVVATRRELAEQGVGDLWDSGPVASDESLWIAYDGPRLHSRQRCWWSVRVGDTAGALSGWAEPSWWEMGLLEPTDWQQSWVTAASWDAVDEPPAAVDLGEWRGPRPALLRSTVTVDQPVVRARIYVTALGLYDLHVNGGKVGADLLRPGWTDFARRVPYQVYDVTELLAEGDNAVGLVLSTGWYCGRVAWGERLYGELPAALLQLHVELADGTEQVHGTDDGWVATPSPLLWSDLLMGEAYDAREELPGWDQPGYDAGAWERAEVVPPPSARLVAQLAPPVRRLGELRPLALTEPLPGRWVFDLGQNISGWARLTVDGPAGAEVRLRFGEMLEPDGTLHTANLRAALATDVVVLAGQPLTYEPRFTTHGFRYVEVTGLMTAPSLASVVGVVIGTDTPRVGTFSCSSALVDRLQSNIEWGQRGNFLEVPTDCPQRDERLGWTGDAQVFVRTACWNSDAVTFFDKWLQDLADTQRPDGAVADVAPLVRPELFAAAAPGWGDAAVLVPWELYQVSGDLRLLERWWPMMTSWVDYVHAANPALLWEHARGQDYGDWLSIEAPTPNDVLATAFFAHSADVVSKAAAVLGRRDQQAHYEKLFAGIRLAFNDAYVTPSGRIVGHQQTVYALALAFDLLPPGKRPAAAEHLALDIADRAIHLSTGFLGVAHLLPVLTKTDQLGLAYELLENETFPSWGYSIRHGATTIWERWDGWTAEQGFKGSDMNSFNHYSLGSVGEWLYTVVAGISQPAGSAGFRLVRIAPRPGGTLTHATATYASPRGLIRSEWRLSERTLTVEVEVPTNVTAEVLLDGVAVKEVMEAGVPLAAVEGVRSFRDTPVGALLEVGGGSYRFRGARG